MQVTLILKLIHSLMSKSNYNSDRSYASVNADRNYKPKHCTYIYRVCCSCHGKKTGLSVEILPTKTTTKTVSESHLISLCRGTEEAVPTEKADASLSCSGCLSLVGGA